MGKVRIPKRRRREAKTDYKLRLNLLKAQKPRIVIRQTNKYIILQAIESNAAQDKVLVTVTSKELLKEGLDKKHIGSLKNIPAAYLTAKIFAKKIDTKQEYIVDIGLAKTHPGSRVFSAVNGLIDAGINISASKKVFPRQERLNAEHISEDAKKAFKTLKEKVE